MKWLSILINLILCSTYELIIKKIRIPNRDFYISTQIQDSQISEIYNAINEYNKYFVLKETYDKNTNHIRIQYGDGLMGYTVLSASLYSDNQFYIDRSIISFNDRLTGNTLQCVILHEVLHSQGLTHNEIEGTVMNYSVKINRDDDIIQDEMPCKLALDDIIGLLEINNN